MSISNQLSKVRKLIKGDAGKCKPQSRYRLRCLQIEQMEDRRLLTTIDLSALVTGQGTTIFGADAFDLSGISVSSAGDVNGDGFDDFIIGAIGAAALGNAKISAGESYLIFGAASLPATIDLANLGSAGVIIFGADAGDFSGSSVSSAGDVNGDGFDDFIIGARGADALGNLKNDAGESYLIFGAASLPATIDLANLGSAGVTLFGADADDRSGWSVSSAGDVNGDGFNDLIIGARFADAFGNAKPNAGESYLIFGAASLPETIDLDNPGSAGVTIFGVDAGDRSGISVSSAGDINGDGFDDLVIGASYAAALGNAKPNAGESYVIFGAASLPATIDLSNLGSAGMTIYGSEAYDRSGFSVSGVGDINGDGFDDLVIGARGAAAMGNAKPYAGESYLIFGAASLPETIDLANLGSAGLTIFGADANDWSGFSVSSAGDFNGDGFDDLVIGAYRAASLDNAKPSAGESYLIFGAASLPETIDLANLGSAGITLFGADSGDQSGRSVSSAGDVNGDGFDDLIIGAPIAAAFGNSKVSAGESYLIFGGDFTGAVTHQGTEASETLTGTTGADVMIGGRGNDILIGNGGADVLRGGEGDDILAISDLSFSRIVGGRGFDTLRLDASGLTLDLTVIPNNRILGIEQIDITGSGNNTLILDKSEVLNISDETNTLIVQGTSGDRVLLDGGWTRGADETMNSVTYRVLTNGAATLKVASDIPLVTPTTIDLAALMAGQGTTIYGVDSGDRSGYSVSSAGDINGDGFDDFVIGAYRANSVGNAISNAGESYVIFGGPTLPATIDLANLGSAGITIFGKGILSYSGRSVSRAGDINGDGFDDLVIGADRASGVANSRSNSGESYVIFGSASLPETINLASLGAAGMIIYGAELGDFSGISVSGAGDVNGDGFDDLIIGAYKARGAGNNFPNAGESYIIFGAAALPATLDLANIGSAGVTIYGAGLFDYSGRSVSGAGDINGDGFDDVVIGAYLADGIGNAKPSSGESYVIFGAAALPATINLANLGSAGITILGADSGDRSGWSVSGAGDVNGDGFDDVVIGAYRASGLENARPYAGDSYVIFGSASPPPTIDLANLGSAGITIFGAEVLDQSGRSVSSAGDVNGDGFDDFIIQAPGAGALGNAKPGAGDSYLIFGSASLPATIDLANLGTAGITIFGADSGDAAVRTARAVNSAGDVNGDGFDDLIIGASHAAAFGNAKPSAGESYVIFGGNFTGAVTHQGTAAAETLTGTAGADVMIGGRGNDILIGNGGADVLRGGEGDDILAISDLSFFRLDGGNGFDTLRLDGSGLLLDLTVIPKNRIVDIEQIDLGGGNNTLNLSVFELLNLSSHSNTLIVRRGAGDVVSIGGGWTQQVDEEIGPDTFEVFTQGAAILKLQLVPATSTIVGSFVNHGGYSGPGSSIDTGKVLAKEGAVPTLLTYVNLINTSRGINGVMFDIDNLPGTVTEADFEFQMSPTGAFDLEANPVGNWTTASAPSAVTIAPGSPDRVSIDWPDNAIENRWLRITVLANANTGLVEPEVYYIGHLLGETTGPSGSVFTISFADITPIRMAVGSSVDASSTLDIDKNGTVAFADISAMRANVGTQLTIIIIPSAGSGGGGAGGGMASGLPGSQGSGAGKGTGQTSVLAVPLISNFETGQGFGNTDRGLRELVHQERSSQGRPDGVRYLRQISNDQQSQGLNSMSTSDARNCLFANIGSEGEYKQPMGRDNEMPLKALSLELESIIEQVILP